mmetsp:Transcript_12289/g.21049  ORF Transcript_12289/g.21049 Transcript_12289/m.21049 type:complete len:465 (-) Transcript_12289:36-1430(-)
MSGGGGGWRRVGLEWGGGRPTGKGRCPARCTTFPPARRRRRQGRGRVERSVAVSLGEVAAALLLQLHLQLLDRGEVRGGDRHQLVLGDVAVRVGGHLLVEQADRGPHAREVDRVAHGARVREEGHGHALGQVGEHRLLRARREVVLELPRHDLANVRELLRLVVGELDVVADARVHARDEGVEALHLVLVASKDDDDVLLVVLHHVEQDLDRLLPVVTVVGRVVQVVRLVHEQDAAHRLLDHLLGLGRGVANVLANQVVARRDHDVAGAAVAHALQDLPHAQRNRGLPGARGAGEAHVQRRHRGLEAELEAHLVDDEQRRDLAHAHLHRKEADQVVVQLLKDLLHSLLEHVVVDRASLGLVGNVAHERDLALASLTGQARSVLALLNLLLLQAALDVRILERVRESPEVARCRIRGHIARARDRGLPRHLHAQRRHPRHRILRHRDRAGMERESRGRKRCQRKR